MPWRVTSRKSGFSALAPERTENGRPIQYAFEAFLAVRAQIMADGFADCICTFVPPNIEPKSNGAVDIRETEKVT